jgi:aminoglycoside phosphotransferase (APT) family kinase protein
MHEGQLQVTAGIVAELIAEQFPEWSRLPITRVQPGGTVHAIFRVGDHLAARLPLQPGDAGTARARLRSEAAAARRLAGATSVPVPVTVAIGEPGLRYPMPWSMQTWLTGLTASVDDPGGSEAFAAELAGFILDVRAIDTGGRTFDGTSRGGDLRFDEAWMAHCFEQSHGIVDVPRLRRIWERLRDLPRRAPDRMTHGDLIPGNVLIRHGRLAGILDVGGLAPADPALDLVAGWHLLEPAPRRRLREELGCDDLEWERGKAWALQQAMGVVWYYRRSNPEMHTMGMRTLERILADGS